MAPIVNLRFLRFSNEALIFIYSGKIVNSVIITDFRLVTSNVKRTSRSEVSSFIMIHRLFATSCVSAVTMQIKKIGRLIFFSQNSFLFW